MKEVTVTAAIREAWDGGVDTTVDLVIVDGVIEELGTGDTDTVDGVKFAESFPEQEILHALSAKLASEPFWADSLPRSFSFFLLISR